MRGVKVVRDKWGVPHINGTKRSAVMFAAGWVTAQDRALLLETIRYPGRVAAVDAPGPRPVRTCHQSAQLHSQRPDRELRAQAGEAAAEVQERPARHARHRRLRGGHQRPLPQDEEQAKPWTRNDALGVGALIGAKFGKDGGDEARRAEFLSRLNAKFGPPRAWRRSAT